jgi:hypothetical protein
MTTYRLWIYPTNTEIFSDSEERLKAHAESIGLIEGQYDMKQWPR